MIPKSLHTEFVDIEDKTLWLRFLEGDHKAYELIYCRYVQNLFSFGMKLNPNRALIKDCIQELFVDLWNRKAHLSVTDNIKFYLFKALKIKLNHALKKEIRTKTSFTIAGIFQNKLEVSYEQCMIEDQMMYEKTNSLLKAMEKLPSRQREALNLLFFENLSYEQVSELMSINVSSAYTLAWKAISSLKKNLKELIVSLSFLLFY